MATPWAFLPNYEERLPVLRADDAPISCSRPVKDDVGRSPSKIRIWQDGAQDGDGQEVEENHQRAFGAKPLQLARGKPFHRLFKFLYICSFLFILLIFYMYFFVKNLLLFLI